MAERPILGGNPQFLKGMAQLVVAGVRLPVRRQKNPLQEKPLGLQIRLPCYHCHAGDSTTGFIFLYDTFHLGSDIHWRHLRVAARTRSIQPEWRWAAHATVIPSLDDCLFHHFPFLPDLGNGRLHVVLPPSIGKTVAVLFLLFLQAAI